MCSLSVSLFDTEGDFKPPKAHVFRHFLTHRFDWGGTGESCDGSGTFQQQIQEGETVIIGNIPAKYEGVRIQLISDRDVDIQLVDMASETEIVAWPDGIIHSASHTSIDYKGDKITYSGYEGDGTNPGNEFIEFSDATNRAYTMKVFGFSSGYAQVSYKWTGQVGCKSEKINPKGSGYFTQNIAEGSSMIVGDLPEGLADIFIRLESTDDIDIQLYDESTPIVDWKEGIVLRDERGFSTGWYAGVEIQYSGFLGEQRPGTYGHEYIFLRGTLAKPLTLKVLGYTSGTAQVMYQWGYYTEARSSGGSTAFRTQLHDTIDGHTQYSYGDCWELLKRTDQDPTNIDNVRLLYSRKSIQKSNQDNGYGGDRWNREHVWPKSHGNFGTRQGAGTDLHALRASDSSVNTDRSSKDFDSGGLSLDGPGSAIDCPACLERLNSFEPPDDVKGSVARMVFYMSIRYNGDPGSNGVTLNVIDSTGTPYGSVTAGYGQLGKLGTLKDWHANYPPSNEEKHRNNLIFTIQRNRNPFIDNPEWVDLLF